LNRKILTSLQGGLTFYDENVQGEGKRATWESGELKN